jgi:hypothetical protein
MRPLLALLLVVSACQTDGPTDTAAAGVPATPADAPLVTVYKSPTCGCCSLWAQHMEREGFRVETVDTADLVAVRDSLGVPGDLSACHTATVGGYTVEGHVPAEQVRRLLAERPRARGLVVPGMPLGSPGMEQGDTRQPYDVLLIDDAGEAAVYAHVPGA